MYKPDYQITPYLLSLIDQASSLRTWIEGATLKVSWLPVLQKEARVKTAHSSTAIEGNPLQLHHVAALDRGEEINSTQKHKTEVHNYLKAMHWIKQNAKATITKEKILELHKILTTDLISDFKCGAYKEKQNYVVNDKGIRIYTPPPPQQMAQLMQELLLWLNSKETQKLHSVLVCAIFHHRLVSIHPFSDGNGRLARTVGTWILYQHGFDTNHIFSLDEFFAGDLKRYYQKIEQARELDDNLTHWIEYVCEGIVSTLKSVKKRVEDLQIYSKAEIYLSPRQEELLQILRDNRALRVAELIKQLQVTRSRINQMITPLVKVGIIVKEGQSKATTYRLN